MITAEEIKGFLEREQGEKDVTPEKCNSIIRYLATGDWRDSQDDSSLVGVGINELEFSEILFSNVLNSAINPEKSEKVYQDMSQPLASYFVNSSHNTYLTGH